MKNGKRRQKIFRSEISCEVMPGCQDAKPLGYTQLGKKACKFSETTKTKTRLNGKTESDF